MENDKSDNKIIIYEGGEGQPRIEVLVAGETVWLSQKQMAELFDCSIDNIALHLKNIYSEGELEEKATAEDSSVVQKEGSRNVQRKIRLYNLDAIISVGYRVNSRRGTQFRIWATQRLKEYIVKGFTMDDERLKNLGGGNYWKELLDRIRDIRSSEKVLYRQVLDLYATSMDYDPNASESIEFFKVVQNKLHYAAHGHTAAEVIIERADAGKPFMGLLTFSDGGVSKKDIAIAKNYLTENELKVLNNIVSAYFDLAEVKAMNREPMNMKDWILQLDRMIRTFDKKVLKDSGITSHDEAIQKAEKEYRKYQVKTLSPVEKAYLDTIKTVQKKVAKKAKDEHHHK